MGDGREGRWEQRWHPLLREWIVVAAHRPDRPWSGEQLDVAADAPPAHDPDCYLCPGNARVGGARNPRYDGVFVFDSDRPSVAADAPRELAPAPGPYRRRPATGVARVVCYTSRHDLTMAELARADVERAVAANATGVAFVPWFARYAYEVHVAPRATHERIDRLSEAEATDFAALLHETLIRMDNLWRLPFPYPMLLRSTSRARAGPTADAASVSATRSGRCCRPTRRRTPRAPP